MKHSAAKKCSAALRSGDYKQGKGQLQDGDKFCCLGVLCKVAESEGAAVEMDDNDDYSGGLFGGDLCDQPHTLDWAGIKYVEGYARIEDLNLYFSLIDLNDNYRLTFDQIADVIDYFWEEL